MKKVGTLFVYSTSLCPSTRSSCRPHHRKHTENTSVMHQRRRHRRQAWHLLRTAAQPRPSTINLASNLPQSHWQRQVLLTTKWGGISHHQRRKRGSIKTQGVPTSPVQPRRSIIESHSEPMETTCFIPIRGATLKWNDQQRWERDRSGSTHNCIPPCTKPRQPPLLQEDCQTNRVQSFILLLGLDSEGPFIFSDRATHSVIYQLP